MLTRAVLVLSWFWHDSWLPFTGSPEEKGLNKERPGVLLTRSGCQVTVTGSDLWHFTFKVQRWESGNIIKDICRRSPYTEAAILIQWLRTDKQQFLHSTVLMFERFPLQFLHLFHFHSDSWLFMTFLEGNTWFQVFVWLSISSSCLGNMGMSEPSGWMVLVLLSTFTEVSVPVPSFLLIPVCHQKKKCV